MRAILFLSCLFPMYLFSQISNETICTQLLERYLAQKGTAYAKIRMEAVLPKLWQIDSLSTKQLEIAKPVIQYQKIENKRYVRKVELFFTQEMAGEIESKKEIFQDTLTKRQLKKLFRTTKAEFQGENPFLFAKFVAPSLVLVGSVAAIVTLFYVRSP
ncbi:MAG: hypothetical protein ACKVTZ_03225 [Bacteroidia bacterium]